MTPKARPGRPSELRVVDLGPGDVADLDEIGDGRLVLIQADADDLEAGVVIGAIGGLEAGQLGDAGAHQVAQKSTRTYLPR